MGLYNTTREKVERDCEYLYNKLLLQAKYLIDRGEPAPTGFTINLPPMAVDFDYLIIKRTWNNRLQNAILDYKTQYDIKKGMLGDDTTEIETGRSEEEERRRREEEERRRREEEERREREERERREREERERKEREERERKRNRVQSIKTLTAPPYGFSEAKAERYICEDGQIDYTALARYEADKKNKEYIAKKAAEWENRQADAQKQPMGQAVVCGGCGHANRSTDKFCRGCGAPLQKECPACGKRLPAGNKFCTGCGAKL